MHDSNGNKSLREISRILFQRWVLLAAIVGVGTVGTWLYCTVLAPKKYRSKISLIFKQPTNRSPISTDPTGERALEVFVKAQQQIVMSDLVLARTKVIAEDKALRDKWYALRSAHQNTKNEADAAAVRNQINDFIGGDVSTRVNKLLTEEQPEFDRFRKSIELETPGGEQVAMTESFTLIVDRPGMGPDEDWYKSAKFAADVLADMYMLRFQELQRELSDPAVRVMNDVVTDYEKYVAERLNEYERFISDHPGDVGVLEQLLKSGTEHGVQILLTKVRENDAKLSMDLARDKAVHDVLTSVLPKKAFNPGAIDEMPLPEVRSAIEGAPAEFIQTNFGIIELQKTLAKLYTKKAKLETQFQPESREMRYVHEEIDHTSRDMLSAIVAQARSLAASVTAREQQLVMNRELLARSEKEQNEVHRKLATYARLKNDFQVAQEHLAELRKQQSDAMSNTLQAREAVTISKLNEASTPDPSRPVSPKTGLYTLAAFLASSLIGIALAFLIDHFDHTLRSSREAERFLGLPVLGSIKKQPEGLILTA